MISNVAIELLENSEVMEALYRFSVNAFRPEALDHLSSLPISEVSAAAFRRSAKHLRTAPTWRTATLWPNSFARLAKDHQDLLVAGASRSDELLMQNVADHLHWSGMPIGVSSHSVCHYLLHEALIYESLRVYRSVAIGGGIRFERRQGHVDHFKRRIISAQVDIQSHISWWALLTRSCGTRMAPSGRALGTITPLGLEVCAQSLVDRTLSLTGIGEFLRGAQHVTRIVQAGQEIAKWVTMAMWAHAVDCQSRWQDKELRVLGLDLELVEELDYHSRSGSAFDRLLRRCDGGIEFCALAAPAYLLNRFMISIHRGDWGVGSWFEKAYVRGALQKLSHPELQIFDGLGANARDPFDVDLIAVDRRHRRLIFFQVKYVQNSHLSYLANAIDICGSRPRSRQSAILKGVNQLRAFRERMGEPAVVRRLCGVVGMSHEEIRGFLDRATCVLVHNCEQLGFVELDRVAMYEWNALRNIVVGRIPRYQDGVRLGDASVNTDIGDLDAVLRSYWSEDKDAADSEMSGAIATMTSLYPYAKRRWLGPRQPSWLLARSVLEFPLQ